MKRCVAACCIVVAWSTICLAQAPAEMELYGKLIISSDRVEALETVLKRAIDRLNKWTPKAPEEYTPGYEFKERLSEKDAHEAAKPNRTEYLSGMGGLATLLNDDEYFAALQVTRKYSPDGDDKIPAKKEEREKAMATLKRIEVAKGLKGFVTARDK